MTEYSIKWVNSAAEITPVLWKNCFPESTVVGEWWYRILEQSHLEPQFKFQYAIIMHQNQEIGIAPVFTANVPLDLMLPKLIAKFVLFLGRFFPFLLYQTILFVGSPCSQQATIGLIEKFSLQDICADLQTALEVLAEEQKVSMIVWKDFPVETNDALQNLVLKKKMTKIESFPGTKLLLNDIKTMDDYYSSLSSSRRYALKRKLKRSKQNVNLTVTNCQFPEEETIAEVTDLYLQSYRKSKIKFECMNIQFFRSIAKVPLSWFILLRHPETKKLVAFMLCFKLDKKILNQYNGFDYSHPSDWFLYFRLWEEALLWVLEQEGKEFDSGQLSYYPKLKLGHQLEPLSNYFKHNNKTVHYIYSILTKNVAKHYLAKVL